MKPQQKIDELYETCLLLFEELGVKLAELKIHSIGGKLQEKKEVGELLRPLLHVVSNTTTQRADDILSERRYEQVVEARFIFCKMAKDKIGATFVDIGNFLGGRHHATIINATKEANNLIATDDEFRKKYFYCETAWLTYLEQN